MWQLATMWRLAPIGRSLQCGRFHVRHEERPMDAAGSADLTVLLRQWRHGDTTVEAKIIATVYDELHRIARRYAALERAGHSLQATALVNEAYLRLVGQRSSW